MNIIFSSEIAITFKQVTLLIRRILQCCVSNGIIVDQIAFLLFFRPELVRILTSCAKKINLVSSLRKKTGQARLSPTLINEEIGEILRYYSGVGSVRNILPGHPFVEILLRMELHSVERIFLVLQRGDELYAVLIVIQRQYVKFVG